MNWWIDETQWPGPDQEPAPIVGLQIYVTTCPGGTTFFPSIPADRASIEYVKIDPTR